MGLLILTKELDYIISNRLNSVRIINGDYNDELFNFLEFFHCNGNSGRNALREMIEDFIDDTVSLSFDTKDGKLYSTLSICYEYHDIDIICYDTDIVNSHWYDIIDTSRESIEKIKNEAKIKLFK